MKKRNLIALTCLFSLISNPLFAYDVVIESPRISGSHVDRCVREYGKTNCSKWATKQSANALCRKLGHSKAQHYWWIDGDSKRNIGTYRLKYTRENGRDKSYWEWCGSCDFYFTKITCQTR